MNRRKFLALCGATGGVIATSGGQVLAGELPGPVAPGLFPVSPKPKHLTALELPKDLSWDMMTTLTCFQGLVNRTEPRLYLIDDDNDRYWLDYYADTYGVSHDKAAGAEALLERFASELDGYVVYDPAMLDSANVATTFGAIHNLLPVSPSEIELVRGLGLDEGENFAGRWTDRYAAYEWALETCWPACNHRLFGAACVDRPLWPSNSIWLRDYAMAHKLFTFDLSASRRDRADRDLLHSVFERVNGLGCVLGWRCVRCTEHEFVELAARSGVSALCGLNTRNLTVHAAIPKRPTPFKQHHITREETRPVEKKVYISFMATDGDALWSMLRMQSGRFDDPEHGEIPFAYGFLPCAWDLMPGVAAANYARKKDKDYFVVPSSGAMYTYPYFQRNPGAYLKLTRAYMEKTDLRAAYMINWDDDHYWQDPNDPSVLHQLRRGLPECTGFFQGQGESAFERQHLDGGTPYIFSGEGLHVDSEVAATFAEFIAANSIRPLFIYCLTNHNITLGQIKAGIAALGEYDVEVVGLDEFLLLAEEACKKELIPEDDFYPDKSKLRVMLQKEAGEKWGGVIERIGARSERANTSGEDFSKLEHDEVTKVILARSATPPSDIVAFDAVWDSMWLARLALNRRGIYVNEKARGVEDFMREFGDITEAAVMQDLWRLWDSWATIKPTYAEAGELAQRLNVLTQALDRTGEFIIRADR